MVNFFGLQDSCQTRQWLQYTLASLTLIVIEHVLRAILEGVELGRDERCVAREVVMIVTCTPLALLQVRMLHVHIQLLLQLLIDLHLLFLRRDALLLHGALAIVVPSLHTSLDVLALVEAYGSCQIRSVVKAVAAGPARLLELRTRAQLHAVAHFVPHLACLCSS